MWLLLGRALVGSTLLTWLLLLGRALVGSAVLTWLLLR
jgi:hypothetical protein